jgi:hypothetical protein
MDSEGYPLTIEGVASLQACSGGGFMSHIVVDEQQAKLISEATGYVEIRDPQGRHIGYAAQGFTEEDIAIAKQRMASDEDCHTTQEVLDHLRSLESR